MILKAEDENYNRGMLVELLENGGYEMAYWYEVAKPYPVEVLVDGKSIKKDARKVTMKFHPELEEDSFAGASLGTPDFLSLYKRGFPEVPIEIAGRRTKAYNCIARSIGVTDRWVWDEVDLNENGEASFSEFIRFYDMHGYRPTSNENDAIVALYGVRNGLFITVKHAARKVNGQWESKMGQGDTLRHHEADIFGGTSYGDLLLYFEQYMEDPIDPRKRITTF